VGVDTVIKNGKLVTRNRIKESGIAIDNGRIVALGEDIFLPEASRIIDAGGKYILPGLVDPHVHLGILGLGGEDTKDTIGAAFGGVTTIGNFLPPGATIDEWKEFWNKNSIIDFFFHGRVNSSETSVREISLSARRQGVSSFKFHMAAKGPEYRARGLETPDDGLFWAAFKEIAALGYPARAQVHAETKEIIDRLTPPIMAQHRQDLAAWDEARPTFCETLAVEKAISFARASGAPLYICHVTNAESMDVIAKAKAEGLPVVGETCIHYLTVNKLTPLGPVGKLEPPLRDEWHSQALWQGLTRGSIECVGTDHCPFNKAIKEDLWQRRPGVPGLEFLLPLMLSEGVNKGRITLEKLVEVCSYNPAKVFGIYPKKGTIEVGSDADLVIIDLEKTGKLSVETAHHHSNFSLYEGWEVKGLPVLTMLRGQILVEDNKLVATRATGNYIPRFPIG